MSIYGVKCSDHKFFICSSISGGKSFTWSPDVLFPANTCPFDCESYSVDPCYLLYSVICERVCSSGVILNYVFFFGSGRNSVPSQYVKPKVSCHMSSTLEHDANLSVKLILYVAENVRLSYNSKRICSNSRS